MRRTLGKEQDTSFFQSHPYAADESRERSILPNCEDVYISDPCNGRTISVAFDSRIANHGELILEKSIVEGAILRKGADKIYACHNVSRLQGPKGNVHIRESLVFKIFCHGAFGPPYVRR